MKKRIALAAVAALAGGLLVAAPASATSVANAPFKVITAVSSSTGTSATETATALAGALNFVELGTVNSSDTVTAGGTLTITGGTFSTTTDGVLSAGNTVITFADGAIGTSSIRIPTPAVGTITVVYSSFAAPSGIGAFTAQQTFTIAVGIPAAAEAYNHSVVSESVDSHAVGGYLGADGVVYAAAQVGVAPNAQPASAKIDVAQYSSADTSTPSSTSVTKAITYSLSGVGSLSISNSGGSYATYWAVSAGGAQTQSVYVYSDGRAGVATVTIAVNGVAVATRTVTFYGAVASFTASIDHAQLAAGGSFVVTVVKKDAAGIAVPTAAHWGVDTGTIGTVYQYVPGTETATVTYGSKSTSTVTVGNYLVDTKTVVANFVTAGAATITLAADKASYAPGEKATFAFTVKNSDGVAAGDGDYAITWATSGAIYSLGTTVTVKNGAGTVTGYMPVLAGPVSLSATIGAGTATLSSSVVDPAAVATAAAITALQTSVATLTTTVASLVASMTAQIKVINATMLKIQKALAALRASLKK